MSKYASYNAIEIEKLLSNFLIDSWSYSGVTTFTRNEKAFERDYIYREGYKRSASAVAGIAYHEALSLYFRNYSERIDTSMIDMEQVAYSSIDLVPANDWKLQKTTPTIEECRIRATKLTSALINNFFKEKNVYSLLEIKRVLGVELRCEEWLTINGVDIPLPCHAYIDLILELKDGRVIIIDHKSKNSFTADQELAMIGGKQSITYVKCFESMSEHRVDEVWIVENKYSQNRDGSPQLKKLKIVLDDDTRRLYEAMLYEPLKRMLEAVSDPDYLFTINDSDNFVDQAELYEFWAKTMIAEVDDFNVPHNKRELISQRLKKIRDASVASVTPKTITAFKKNAASFITYDFTNKDMTNSEKIEHVLRTFGVIVRVAYEIEGYSSNTYLLQTSAGVRIDNVRRYRLDIASALNVSSVRMGENLMVYKGASYLFIETPKKRTKDLLFDPAQLEGKRIPIGVDNFGRVIHWDLNNHSTPHMLICGATGSGKSVLIISTVEYAKLGGVDSIIIFDPKYEFCHYSSKTVKVFNEIRDIENEMKRLVDEMNRRQKSGARSKTLIVFDEFADAVSASRSGSDLDIREEVVVGTYATGLPKLQLKTVGRLKSLEENLKILLQKGRSLGYRVIAATQRASVNVITGDAKVNFPVLVCFRVPKEVDSKVVLDESGAETLAGMGDGLMRSPEYPDLVRFQGYYKT